jgi:hypothetical protein
MWSSALFMFSNETGLLKLSPEALEAVNVTIVSVTIPSTSDCFGPPLHKAILHYVTGYAVPILNAFLQAFGPAGAVKVSVGSGGQFIQDLSSAGSIWET